MSLNAQKEIQTKKSKKKQDKKLINSLTIQLSSPVDLENSKRAENERANDQADTDQGAGQPANVHRRRGSLYQRVLL